VIRPAALLASALALASVDAGAATAYVTDQLVLGVYAQQNQQGQYLTTLHSGASVEVLATNGDFSQVRLSDGAVGWVKSTYLTTQLPAVARIKELEAELDRSRATTPALAEAAAHSEVLQLQAALAAKQAELTALRGPGGGSANATSSRHPLRTVVAVVLALGLGFWLGYATLARRIKHKFGGLKVY
jgi:SH3 domain protein